MKILARRLLLEETKAQIQIRHTNTTVQKGSLIQALLFDDIAEKFEGVGAIEKEHEARYLKLLDNVKKEIVFSRDGDTIWQCANCGHICIGKKAPDVCPVCDHPQAYFQIKAENF